MEFGCNCLIIGNSLPWAAHGIGKILAMGFFSMGKRVNEIKLVMGTNSTSASNSPPRIKAPLGNLRLIVGIVAGTLQQIQYCNEQPASYATGSDHLGEPLRCCIGESCALFYI